METLRQALEYAANPRSNFWGAVGTHLQLSVIALVVAGLVGVSLGIWLSRYRTVARLAINVSGFLRVVPPLAVLFLLLPSQGIGFRPSVIALTLLAIPPLLINTDAGMRSVDRAIVEAAMGLGMTRRQLLARVELPLALPVILAGLRIAAVEVIASATLATLIGGGGLGDFIASGLAQNRDEILLVGAVPVALIALGAEMVLSTAQRRLAARTGVTAGNPGR